MAAIGREGARVFHELYTLYPVGTSYFAIVSRESGHLVAVAEGRIPYERGKIARTH